MTFDVPTVVALIVIVVSAAREFRLLKVDRRKVIAQGSDLSTQAADRMLTHWEGDNKRLRERVDQLEANEERLEHRIDSLEALLREHGVEIPAPE